MHNSSDRRSAGLIACALASVFTAVVLALPLPAASRADSASSTYEEFYGSVYNDDALVGPYYIVSAIIGATKVAETATDALGRYGYNPQFIITASNGAYVQFSLNDHPTLQHAVFQGGAVTQLDLKAYGAGSSLPCSSCSGGSCSGSSCGINPKTLPQGTVGCYYSAALQALGGQQPYMWSIASGNLPPGLSIDSSLGTIYGTPTMAQTYIFTVRVTDSRSYCMSAYETIYVNDQAGSGGSQPASLTSLPAPTAIAPGYTYNFLSNTDSLPLSNGVLTTARELSSSDGRVRLSLPAGDAIDLQGQAMLGAASESNPPSSADGSIAVKAYSFTPPGATFSPPATMTLRYDTPLPSKIDESSLYIAYWNGSSWIKLNSTLNTNAREVSAGVSHFTIFAIRGMAPTTDNSTVAAAASLPVSNPPAGSTTPPAGNSQAAVTAAPAPAAGMTYTDLVVSPRAGKAGEPVAVSVRVSNPGGSELTETVALLVNDRNEQQKAVTLGVGKSELVSFDITKTDPGTYTVKIENLSGTFQLTAQAAEPAGQQPAVQPVLLAIIVLAGGLLPLTLFLVLISRRRSR